MNNIQTRKQLIELKDHYKNSNLVFTKSKIESLMISSKKMRSDLPKSIFQGASAPYFYVREGVKIKDIPQQEFELGIKCIIIILSDDLEQDLELKIDDLKDRVAKLKKLDPQI